MTVPSGANHIEHRTLNEATTDLIERETVLIAGGGPVGLILAQVLAKYGVRSTVLERNEATTRWPKMDLTNIRSMELLRRVGLANDIRTLGVPSTTPYRVLVIPGLHAIEPITSWDFPCVDDLNKNIRANNDGSMPLEPWQRISQAIFEKYLKSSCDKNPLIDCCFGWKVEKSTESESNVVVQARNVRDGQLREFCTKYLVGCDGASSRTRRDVGISLDGGPIPGYTLLVHFRSRDLARLFKMGRFWHLFICNEQGLASAAISQDDEYIFTTHLLLPLDAKHEEIDSHDAVYRALGGMGGPFKIEIDEILVRSTYRHSIAVARTYRSPLGRVFLAGDSAHQNIPTGGYGMNMGIGDAFDLGWKLAASIHLGAGPFLLDSYEQERRPVALMSIERSGIHMQTHMALRDLLGSDPRIVEADNPEGREMRKKIHDHYQSHNGENTDVGVEMDHRHRSSVYPRPADEESEPPWTPERYTPSTFPGSRAPHVFLKDGTPIFDLLGDYWTLFEFPRKEAQFVSSQMLLDCASAMGMPVKHALLRNEAHASKIWHDSLVLVRPDGHVSWRGEDISGPSQAQDIMRTVFGQVEGGWVRKEGDQIQEAPLKAFSGTNEVNTQVENYNLEQMGVMQT